MKNCIYKELLYGMLSKKYLFLFIALIFVFVGSEIVNYFGAVNAYDFYQHYIDFYNENNMDIQEDIDEEFYTREDEGGATFISNPLAYFKQEVIKKYYACDMRYVLEQFFEDGIFLFPIIFTVFGAIFGVSDYRYGTMKFKAGRDGKIRVNLAKQISLIISAFSITLVAMFISAIPNFFIFHKIKSTIPIADFVNKNYVFEGMNMIKGIVFTVFVIVFFVEAGYSLSVFLKNSVVPILGVVLYWYLCPPLSVFEPRNLLSCLADKIFHFNGCVMISQFTALNGYVALAVTFMMILALFFLNYVTVNMRSAY